MDETTFRILDTLSRALGRALSINELSRRIKTLHGTADYKNIYEKLQTLNKEKIINLTKTGRSQITTLNFKNYLLIDLLAETELRRKQDLLRDRRELQMLFLELDTYFNDPQFQFLQSISCINPEKNIRLNRIELLILFKGSRRTITIKELNAVHEVIRLLQSMHNIKIDYLMLSKDEFIDFLKSEEANPLREMLSDKITFFYPQSFWLDIRSTLENGIQIRIEQIETNPAKISEQDLVYNLARLGYKEIGTEIKQEKDICIEYMITAILLRNKARRIEAIPIMLAKNKSNYNLLMFLCQKYEVSSRLLGLLKILNKIRHAKEIQQAIEILQIRKIKEIKANEGSIRQKMRLYNVT